MAIKKKMTLAEWWKKFNPRMLERRLETLSLTMKADSILTIMGRRDMIADLGEDARQYLQNRDLSRLENNLRKSVRASDFQPVCDPYGLIKETQHFGLEPSILGYLFGDFDPDFDWIFKGFLYELTGKHRNLSVFNADHIKLLILEQYDKDRKQLERLQRLYGTTTEETKSFKRPNIPERVRIKVWRRDSGKCVKFGSRERLEYDHIIPISKGGSNTARNIELLCEKCNRSKSNKIE